MKVSFAQVIDPLYDSHVPWNMKAAHGFPRKGDNVIDVIFNSFV